jgi:hypothetical protein
MGRNFAPGAEFRETAQLQASFVPSRTVGVFEEIPAPSTLQTEPESESTPPHEYSPQGFGAF